MKTIYFISSPWPSDEDKQRAKDLGAVIRNGSKVTGVTEHCESVAGAIPNAYSHFPVADKSKEDAPQPIRPKRGRPRKQVISNDISD